MELDVEEGPGVSGASSTTSADDSPWDADEKVAWEIAEDLWPGAFAEKHRYLDRTQTADRWAGAYNIWNQPATIVFMWLLVQKFIRMVTVLKHSQGGWSEAVRNWLASRAYSDPDPALVVLPNREKARNIVVDRLIPLFTQIPVLSRLMSGLIKDKKSTKIVLSNPFVLRAGWSGSMDSVSSDPSRYHFCDELSRFDRRGKNSIMDSVIARGSTFDYPMTVAISTPGDAGDKGDLTANLFETAQVKLYGWVKCPHCGTWQRLIRQRLKWSPDEKEVPDKLKRAAMIELNHSAWFECENSKCPIGKIQEQYQPQLVREMCWATADQSYRIFNDLHEEGERPPGSHYGLHAPAFYSLAPKHRWSQIASAFVQAEGNTLKMKGVYNELFAEVWYENATVIPKTIFEKKCLPDPERNFIPGRPKLLPKWCARLIMTVDVQKTHFYYVIRAWGRDYRSRRIAHGMIQAQDFQTGLDQLDLLWQQAAFPYEDNVYPPLKISMVGIDSGGGILRTEDVNAVAATQTEAIYRWTMRYPGVLKAIKGVGRDKKVNEWTERRSTYRGKISTYEILRYDINSNFWEGILHGLVSERMPGFDPQTGELIPDMHDKWELNAHNDGTYNDHMCSTKQVPWKGFYRWVPVTNGARHDFRDCEVYQVFMAYGPADVWMAPAPEETARMRADAGRSVMAMTMPDGTVISSPGE